MNRSIDVGQAFGAQLAIHISWLWFLPLVALTLVGLSIEPWPEALITSLLLFGSVLTAALVQLWTARRSGLHWRKVTLFILGGVVARRRRSTPDQELRVAGAGVLTHLLLGLLFAVLWEIVTVGAVQIEMRITALFNGVLLLFSLLLRLTPKHDNVLHALLSRFAPASWSHYVLTLLHTLALIIFAVSGVFLMGISWLLFACWFGLALTLSQLTGVAEQQGEYSPVAAPATVEQMPARYNGPALQRRAQARDKQAK